MSSHQMNSARRPPSHCWCAGTINEEDNVESVVEWLRSGEFTPKLFEKHLRHTARDISQGVQDGQGVTLSLMATIWFDKSEDTSLLRALSAALATVILPPSTSRSKRMVVDGWLGNFLYYKDHCMGAEGSVIDVSISLVDAIKSIRSYVRTNDQWADKVGEPSGQVYRSASPVYKLTETQFVDSVCETVGEIDSEKLWQECEQMRRTTNDFLRLTGDYHPIFYTCWECDQCFEKILKCGTCKAALYCSRKCQKAAWKGGHKKKCDRLKMMHKRLVANLKEVERAHVTGVHHGLVLSPCADCWVMKLCLDNYTLQTGGIMNQKLKTSMKSFYENLGRISRGEWWVYDLSDQDGTVDNEANDTTQTNIVFALNLLTVDWFADARSKLGTPSVSPQQVTQLTDPYFRSKCGAPISAKAMLQIYSEFRIEALDLPFRPDFKFLAYTAIRVTHDELEKYMDESVT